MSDITRAQKPRPKVHMAAKFSERGGVSAACFTTPRAIDLKRATWTLRPDAVTCVACRAATK